MSSGASSAVAAKLERLGQPPDARVLIVNGDDLGMSHAANAATFDSMEHGLMTAASLMMPCPWAYDACLYLQQHADLDVGVHLTLTSEWRRYRWGPLLGAERCPSLVDDRGFFYPAPAGPLSERAVEEQVRAEADAQIQRAYAWGLEPTNVDGHMSTFYRYPLFLGIYVEMAHRYRLPLRMMPRAQFEERGTTALYDAQPLEGLMYPDDVRSVALSEPAALKGQFLDTLRSLKPGITEVLLHAALRTPEAEAIMDD